MTTNPMTTNPMTTNPPSEELLQTLRELSSAWATGGPAAVTPWCAPGPELLVYDANGHSFRGAAHWSRSPSPSPAPGGEPMVWQNGDVGWACYPDDTAPSRLSLVLERGPEGWHIKHIHSSPTAPPGPRPGGI